jgi:hypothetical protein
MNNARARNTLMVLDARWAISSALSTKSWRQVRVGQDGNQRGCFVRALGSSHSSHVAGSVGDHRHRLRLRMLVIRLESRTVLIAVQCIAVIGRQCDCFDLVVPT